MAEEMTSESNEFQWLRLLSVVAPAAFVAAVIVATAVFAGDVPLPLLISAAVLVVTAAAVLFSSVVFQVIERAERRLRERSRQLAAVQAAATSLSSEPELRPMLERFVELSRAITDARYGALAVRSDDGSIDEFIVSGISEEEQRRIGDPPVGHGVLGVIIEEGAAIRIPEIAAHPRSVGFPEHHPPMRSLLGVPIVSRGSITGNLYLTDKETAPEFSETDEEMVTLFASHAAVAVENARLHEQSRAFAVLEERERIGMDLHDGVIQALYGVGLRLEDALETADREEVRALLEQSVDRLDTVMKEIRSYIYELRPEVGRRPPFPDALRTLALEFESGALSDAEVRVEVDGVPPMSSGAEENLLQIAREALTNVAKHADAREVTLAVRTEAGGITLDVSDNGRGIEPEAEGRDGRHGLANMRERARRLGGTFELEAREGGGTRVHVQVPVRTKEQQHA